MSFSECVRVEFGLRSGKILVTSIALFAALFAALVVPEDGPNLRQHAHVPYGSNIAVLRIAQNRLFLAGPISRAGSG